jgi:hypothetical protein
MRPPERFWQNETGTGDDTRHHQLLLPHYKNHMKPMTRIYKDSEGVSFANVEKASERRFKFVPDVTKVKCFACNKMGHCANDFPTQETPEVAGTTPPPPPAAVAVLAKKVGKVGAMFLTISEEDAYDDVDGFIFHLSSDEQVEQAREPKLDPS